MEPDLQRFVTAQDAGGAYDAALRELRQGRKRGHWVWFVLPQLAGLGRSEHAQRYGLRGLAEARAYLAHPVLGPRLRETLGVLSGLDADDPARVLGDLDALKLRSCLTVFERADPAEPLPARLLERWYGGRRDELTVRLLERQ